MHWEDVFTDQPLGPDLSGVIHAAREIVIADRHFAANAHRRLGEHTVSEPAKRAKALGLRPSPDAAQLRLGVLAVSSREQFRVERVPILEELEPRTWISWRRD